jgi:prepilin-type N-terminal cleavage/methylation domain-containing protein
MCTHHATFRRSSRPRAAFTLIELMISIALVLLLMLGINQVFKVTGEAVGTNQAISTGLRDGRAAQAMLSNDFNTWASDGPAIIIHSARVSAFRNKADELADRDWDPNANPAARDLAKRTIDLDGNGLEAETAVPGEVIPLAIYNNRSHRIDTLSFFGRGLFRRQTGGAFLGGNNLEEYVADMSSNEAWIWYGHLRRPDYSTPASPQNILEQYEHRNPGDDPPAGERNDNNFHAVNWMLGRMAVLLVRGQDTNADGIGDVIKDRHDREQRFIKRNFALANDSVQPLRDDARSNDSGAAAQQWQLRSGRYDLAGTDFAQFRQILENNIALMPPEHWYESMDFRFQGDPTPLKPLTPDNAARTTPVFMEHCTQFIVEYAGDFVEQSRGMAQDGAPAGQVMDVDSLNGVYHPDGQIDFVVINPDTPNESRRVRWYGMPRDVTSPTGGPPDGLIASSFSAVGNTNALVDVVPLHDVLDTATGGFVYMPPSPTNSFVERVLPRSTPQTPFGPPPQYYADYRNPGGGMPTNGQYVVAWGPDTNDQPRPKMIRIVVTIDDPEGRIAEGQTFEYVYRVGG